eukprot:TRINITY_DN4581_c0_g1_i1.p1 TRINITY_DN4581_c0_g1~~TRINITY_DN4581_c0_g1_i1.p1  ORF type:complete len:2414 (+),score=560.66 TRINITY_DN4581_c0_g1_i1:50-7291(+)
MAVATRWNRHVGHDVAAPAPYQSAFASTFGQARRPSQQLAEERSGRRESRSRDRRVSRHRSRSSSTERSVSCSRQRRSNSRLVRSESSASLLERGQQVSKVTKPRSEATQKRAPPAPTIFDHFSHQEQTGQPGRAASLRRELRARSSSRAPSRSRPCDLIHVEDTPRTRAPSGPRIQTPSSSSSGAGFRGFFSSFTPSSAVAQDAHDPVRIVVCTEWSQKRRCQFGDYCSFAHPGAASFADAIDRSFANHAQVSQRPKKQDKRSRQQQRDAEEREKEELQRAKELSLLAQLEAVIVSDEQDRKQRLHEHEQLESLLARGTEPEQAHYPETVQEEEHQQPSQSAPNATDPYADASPRQPETVFTGVNSRGLGTSMEKIVGSFEDKPWEVVLSENSFQRLQKAAKKDQDEAMKVLEKLASGIWPPEVNEEVHKEKYLKLRQASTKPFRILWGIDLDFSYDRNLYVEVLQVWDVLPQQDVSEAIARIGEEWRNCRRKWDAITQELKRQNDELKRQGGQPATPSVAAGDKPRLPRHIDRSILEDCDVVSVRKFFRLDADMLHGILFQDGEDAVSAGEHLKMRISKQEANIISKPGPLIVIGRSGSGKTLCCVYRMFFQHQKYWQEALQAGGEPLLAHRGGGLTHLNQIFVTHSAGLASKVEEYFNNLRQNATAVAPPVSGRRVQFMDQGRLPDDMQNAKEFPLFLTYRKLLIMIDGCTRQPFFPRRPGGALDTSKVQMAVDTLDPLSSVKSKGMVEVDFNVFRKRFWPKLQAKVPHNCDPSLVWREFQSHIKGSCQVLNTAAGHLSLQDYCDMATKVSSGFDGCREQIYNAFKAYEEQRKDSLMWDRMDACFHVVKTLKSDNYRGPPIHSIAVDEVQDLSQLELSLFFHVCPRPFDGLFMTGDTSQTVSRAVDFRFCDCRSLFTHFNQPAPELDQLIMNYRSHQRVITLSDKGIVKVIEEAFPHSIDKLQPDLGHRDGPPPILCTDVEISDLSGHVLACSGMRSNGIAFGASQCILVRNEDAVKRLPKDLQGALVLTIEQSKGLEFDDVIMVNFFKDSPYKDWQVMKSFQTTSGQNGDEQKKKRPQFERHRHALLCSELKHLYTGVTRTKHVLLFIEEDYEQAKHAFYFWLDMDLVNEGLLKEENDVALRQLAERAGASQGQASWKARGHKLLERNLFSPAKGAFEKAGDKLMVNVCNAYICVVQARDTYDNSVEDGKRLFSEAAEKFNAVTAEYPEGRQIRAVCLFNAGRVEDAARQYEALGGAHLEEAANCYEKCGKLWKASELYLAVGAHRSSLDCLVAAGLEQEIKRGVLRAHEEKALPAEECFEYLQDLEAHAEAAVLFKREGNLQRAALSYHSAGMADEEALCYVEQNNYEKAAEIRSKSQEPRLLLQAAEYYEQVNDDRKAAECYGDLLDAKALKPDHRIEILQKAAKLHERFDEWARAGDRWWWAGMHTKAISSFSKAEMWREVAEVCMDLTEQLTEEGGKDFYFGIAASNYEKAKDWVEARSVYQRLKMWHKCGELGRRQEDYGTAAKDFEKAGDLKSAVDCHLCAKDFKEAKKALKAMKTADPQQLVKCHMGLKEYIEAAEAQIQALPGGDTPEEKAQRDKEVLQAFDMAKQDTKRWKTFLERHKGLMPDRETVARYFLEMGVSSAKELAEHFQEEGDAESAAAVLSLAGYPVDAIEALRSSSLMKVATAKFVDPPEPDREMSQEEYHHFLRSVDDAHRDHEERRRKARSRFDGHIFAVLHLATLVDAPEVAASGAKQAAQDLKALQDAVKLLQDHGASGTIPWSKSEFIGKLLDRQAKAKRMLLKSEVPDLITKELGSSLWLRFDVFKAGASDTNVKEKLACCMTLRKEIDKLKSGHGHQFTINLRDVLADQYLQEYYGVNQYALYHEFYRKAEALVRSRRREPDFPWTSGAALVPATHALAKVNDRAFCKTTAIPLLVELVDARQAAIEHLSDHEEELLNKAAQDEKRDQTAMPQFWNPARQAAPVDSDRRKRLEAAFLKAIKDAVLFVGNRKGTLSKVIQDHFDDCARATWSRATEEAGKAKRRADELHKLSRAMKELVEMYAVHGKAKDDPSWVVRTVEKLVMENTTSKKCRPLCPYFIQTNSRNRCQSWDCKLYHPEGLIWKTCSPEGLMASSDHFQKRFPHLFGIGLPAWMDLDMLCEQDLRTGCNKEHCGYLHPEKEIAKELRRALAPRLQSKGPRSYECRNEAAQVFDRKRQQDGFSKKMPHGFGVVYVPNDEMARSVQRLAVLADILSGDRRWVGCQASKDVFRGMCQYIFRYPDAEAGFFVTKSLTHLQKNNPDEFKYLDDRISAEVDGSEKPWRNLLAKIINPHQAPQPQYGQTKVLQRGHNQNGSSYYPQQHAAAAPTVSRNTGQASQHWQGRPNAKKEQVNKWADSNRLFEKLR